MTCSSPVQPQGGGEGGGSADSRWRISAPSLHDNGRRRSHSPTMRHHAAGMVQSAKTMNAEAAKNS
jgi:hypothetical protein